MCQLPRSSSYSMVSLRPGWRCSATKRLIKDECFERCGAMRHPEIKLNERLANARDWLAEPRTQCLYSRANHHGAWVNTTVRKGVKHEDVTSNRRNVHRHVHYRLISVNGQRANDHVSQNYVL
jgi:hypothetical protein